MKNYEEIASTVVENVGGIENVSNVFHCATRLRFKLNDVSLVNKEVLEKNKDIMGVVANGNNVQVIIGNDVSKVFEQLGDVPTTESTDSESKDSESSENSSLVSRILTVLSSIMGPVIPLIMTSGLISALTVILVRFGLSTESSTYIILSMIGNAAFYFLPILVAYTSALTFKTNVPVSIFLGALLVSPTLIELAGFEGAVTLFGLPVVAGGYSSTLIPIIITLFIYKYVEKLVDRIVPKSLKFVFGTFLSIVIIVPIMLVVTAPLGGYIGTLLNTFMTSVNAVAPWASVLIIGSLAPLLVLTGMHLALIPLVFSMFETVGYDNMLFVAFIGMNFSMFGVAIATFFKTKSPNLRAVALSGAITTFFAGVTEPTLYGICLRLKKPLIAAWIACVANAIYASIFSVKVFHFGAPSFFTLPIFLDPSGSMTNFYFAIGAIVLTIVVSFVATWVLGFDDSLFEN